MADGNEIVIKKVKKGGHGGHHGGAWKVAYADFVTAMMAFFLLLWLLNATTEEQKRGIAEYFTPAAFSVASPGADSGVLAGDGLTGEGATKADARAPTVVVQLVPSQASGAADEDDIEELMRQREEEAFEEAQEAIRQAIQADPTLAELADQLLMDMTPEGLRIQIIDQEGGSMFPSGSAQMKPRTGGLVRQIAQVVNELPNKVVISGHTDATPFHTEHGYTNWELSSDRANAARRALVDAGVPFERIVQVTGKADTEPFNAEDPFLPENRRISIVLRRGSQVLPESLR